MTEQALSRTNNCVYRLTYHLVLVTKWLGDALWSPSHFVATCGGASLETVRGYVRSQSRPD